VERSGMLIVVGAKLMLALQSIKSAATTTTSFDFK
jgi:hypothetical protein